MPFVICCAVLWALLPLLPAVLAGGIPGSPFTDLYPSVWSLWAFGDWIQHPPQLSLLNHPAGQAWYPAAPLKSALAQPLLTLCSAATVYTIQLALCRVATVLCFYRAGLRLGLGSVGAQVLVALAALSPMVHGASVEGIIELQDAWVVGLWLWQVGRQSAVGIALSTVLVILSSWYYGAVVLLLMAVIALSNPALRKQSLRWTLLGAGLSTPLLLLFLSAFPEHASLPAAVRMLMGFQWTVPTPHWIGQPTLFAISTYVGWSTGLLILLSRDRRLLWAGIPFVLSMGLPIINDLPLISELRFPYRLHLATLILLALPLAKFCQQRQWAWAPWLIGIEFILLPAQPFLLPYAPATVSWAHEISRPVLTIPGPLSRLPGEHNPSKPRSGRQLFAQTIHQQPIGWSYDFNALQLVDSPYNALRHADPTAQDSEKAPLEGLQLEHIGELLFFNLPDPAIKETLNVLGFHPSINNEALWIKESHDD